MTIRLTGGCLCGAIRYIVSKAPEDPLNCHCRMCRKAQGVAFRSRAAVKRSGLTITDGDDHLQAYPSSPGQWRTFCRTCGSPIITRFDDYPDCVGLALGTLDHAPGMTPRRHAYTDSRAPWDVITDALPQLPAGS